MLAKQKVMLYAYIFIGFFTESSNTAACFCAEKKIIPEGLIITTRAHEQMAGKCESKSPAFPQIPATPAQLTRLRIFLSEQKFDFVK